MCYPFLPLARPRTEAASNLERVGGTTIFCRLLLLCIDTTTPQTPLAQRRTTHPTAATRPPNSHGTPHLRSRTPCSLRSSSSHRRRLLLSHLCSPPPPQRTPALSQPTVVASLGIALRCRDVPHRQKRLPCPPCKAPHTKHTPWS